jgi:hypothetical protein
MSSNSTSNRRRTAVGIGVAAGAAFAAGIIGLGTAGAPWLVGHSTTADVALAGNGEPTSLDHDPFSDLFGSQNADDPTSVGGHNAALDTSLYQSDPGTATQFDTVVDEFEASQDHPLTDLVNFIDPSAFTTQTDPDIVDAMGDPIEYLVPAAGAQLQFADLIVGLDFVLTGSGLPFLLDPAVDTLIFGANGLFDLGF